MLRRLVLLAGVMAAGCSTPLAQLRKDVGPSAAEYLECPEAQLELTELARLFSTTRVKVDGCGRSGIWQLEESQWKRERSAK